MIESVFERLYLHIRLSIPAFVFPDAIAQHVVIVDVVVVEHGIALGTLNHEVNHVGIRLLFHQHHLHAVRQIDLADAIVQYLLTDDATGHRRDVKAIHFDALQVLRLYHLHVGQLLVGHLLHTLPHRFHLFFLGQRRAIGHQHAYQHVVAAGYPTELLLKFLSGDSVLDVSLGKSFSHI